MRSPPPPPPLPPPLPSMASLPSPHAPKPHGCLSSSVSGSSFGDLSRSPPRDMTLTTRSVEERALMIAMNDRIQSPPKRVYRGNLVIEEEKQLKVRVKNGNGDLVFVKSSGRDSVDRELMGLLEGNMSMGHRRIYSDWGQMADDALSLEELELQADVVTEKLDRIGERDRRRKSERERIGMLRNRLRVVVEGLAECQMKTAGMAATAQSWNEGGGRDQVRGLRLTLDHVAKMVLENAQRLLDDIDRYS